MDKLELITQLQRQAAELPFQDSAALDALRRRAEMIIRNVFGPSSKYLTDLSKIDFHVHVYPCSDEYIRDTWKLGQKTLQNLFQTMEEEVKLFELTIDAGGQSAITENSTGQVFVVHGHDEEMKQAAARTLTKLHLDPVILHEKPNQGRTIIEKFTDYSAVSFAVILLSPDDVARPRNADAATEKFRARQNVILELGYFLGKLGRDRVVALYRQEKDFEMPSDFSGVLFVPYDANGRWQFDLARELKASGYAIDANKLMD